MIVRFLSSTASFAGVSYNTNKIDKNTGELILVKNFGALQGLDHLRPKDYVNYLKMIAAQNSRIKLPQFHVAISAQGHSHSKQELAEIAVKWMASMGYQQQPYLVVFHKDTQNNHVHIVSARVDKQGRKISSAFEHSRGIRNLNKITAKTDLDIALSYNFTTKAQFAMILEAKGYILNENEEKIQLIRFGEIVDELDQKSLELRLSEIRQMNQKVIAGTAETIRDLRVKQLKAIFHKYLKIYPTVLSLNSEGAYTSLFAEHLKKNFGLYLIFHGKNGLAPYGYTILDHAGKNVFKGGEIMGLKDMLNNSMPVPELPVSPVQTTIDHQGGDRDSLTTDHQFSDHTNSPPVHSDNDLYDDQQGYYSQESNDQDSHDTISDGEENSDESTSREQSSGSEQPATEINLADDIDDEAILGRNRRRQKKARTNTR